MSDSPVLHSRWPLLLKIEIWHIFGRGHPRIVSAKFGWDWLSSFRGEEFFLISSPLFSNFLFTNLFSIKCLYFFIISSLVPYFNLLV
jgi:hypothetical protein